MSRPIIFLALSALFIGLAWSVNEPDADACLAKETVRLQRTLDRMAAQLEAGSERSLHELVGSHASERMQLHDAELDDLFSRTGTVYLGLIGDSLVYWSGTVVIGPSQLKGVSRAHLKLAGGVYLHAMAAKSDVEVHVLRPNWITPPIENRYLQHGFHGSLDTPAGLIAATSAGPGPSVHDTSGEPMFRLAWRDGTLEVGRWLWMRLCLALLALVAALAAAWQGSMLLVRSGNRWAGVLVFTALLYFLRTAQLLWAHVSPFDRLPLFDPAVYATSFAFPSLGDLLINAVLLVLVAAFMRIALRGQGSERISPLLAGLCCAICLLHGAWITQLFIGLVTDSSVDLDLYHVQGLSSDSAIALLSVALLFASWVLLTMALIDIVIHRTSIRVLVLSGIVVLALSVVAHHFFHVRDTILFLWPVPLALLLIWRWGRPPRFAQILLGVALVAAFSAHVLTKFTHTREQRERQVLAERLAVREDPVVELMFRELAPRLRASAEVYRLLSGGVPCGSAELDQRVRQRFFSGYWERYDVRLFAFGPQGEPLCATDPEPPKSFGGVQSAFTLPTVAVDMPDLFMQEQPGQTAFYHARVAVMPNDSLAPTQLVIELHPRSAAQGLGFPDLLLSGDDPLMRRAERYVRARYENSQLVDRSKGVPYPLQWNRPLDHDGMQWYTEDGYENLAKGDLEGTLLVLGLPRPTLMDQATTFSYLFALFSVLVALVFLGVMLVRSNGLPAMGIGAKVRVALGLFSLIGLFFFGFGTQRLLTRQYAQQFRSALLEKARSVHAELQQRFDAGGVLDATDIPYLEFLLGRASNVFFTDITVYDVHGRLLATSRPQIFAAGLLGRVMDPAAYRNMVVRNASSFVHEEAIGKADFLSAYLPLRDRKGEVIAYIALPSFADQAQREEERSGVLVAVINLFILLFALSVLVAVFISNWTTRPLDLLKRSLASVALGGTNNPIRYRGDDEVGQLVEVYNRKVEELRESAEKLARSERETAWREMAQQVAHEIKNPLTPMKLGIQHFQRTWSPDTPGADERLERFSTGMVQQIDALNSIANAFGDFARMPRANPEDLDLADVAGTALAVFHGTPDVRLTLEQASNAPLIVRADREQLLRVFNNLLKNAIQAVPDGRAAEIRVVLRRENDNVIAEVHDNGSGIAEGDRERIFQPNFTTKSSGMGLGLAMVLRIAENAGGTVRFETRVDEGTRFIVALPLAV